MILFIIISFVLIYFQFKRKILINILNLIKNKKQACNIKYYRGIIDDCSPMIFARLTNKDIRNSDVIVSMILYLEEKNIIDVNERNEIILINDKHIYKHEKFFVENIKLIFSTLNNNVKTKQKEINDVFDNLKEYLYEDMLEMNMIEEKNNNKIKTATSLTFNFDGFDFFIFLYIIFASIFLGESASYDVSIQNTVIITYWITIISNMLINIINIVFNLKIEYLKTLKGYEYTQKVKAQKRFLKEYSLISQKTIKDKEIWKYYIMIAIFFNLKGKLDNDAKKFYKKVLKKYNCIKLKEKSYIWEKVLGAILLVPWLFIIIVSKDKMFQTIILNIVCVPWIYSIIMDMYRKK